MQRDPSVKVPRMRKKETNRVNNTGEYCLVSILLPSVFIDSQRFFRVKRSCGHFAGSRTRSLFRRRRHTGYCGDRDVALLRFDTSVPLDTPRQGIRGSVEHDRPKIKILLRLWSQRKACSPCRSRSDGSPTKLLSLSFIYYAIQVQI